MTIVDNSYAAFGSAAPNLTAEQEALFDLGDLAFDASFVAAQSGAPTGDLQTGLGPLFNANACIFCHPNEGRGHLPQGAETPEAIFLRVSLPGTSTVTGGVIPFPGMNDQMQNHAITGVPIEAQLTISYDEEAGTYADGEEYSLRVPTYEVSDLATPVSTATLAKMLISPRLAPPIVNRGLLEAIPEADILAQQDIEDVDGDGISGKANMVWNAATKTTVLGRIGLKANNPNLNQQNAGAYRGDMGVTNPYFPVNSSDGQVQDDGLDDDPELDQDTLDQVNYYTKTFGVPAPRGVGTSTVEQGRALFIEYNCTGCHVERWVTGPHPDDGYTNGDNDYDLSMLANQVIFPYTDLLLHDMGAGLADGRPDFLADGNEWRTPPLWGIGLTEIISGKWELLHDGRARSLEEAILWHDGEAKDAKERFRTASKADREALISFLKSL